MTESLTSLVECFKNPCSPNLAKYEKILVYFEELLSLAHAISWNLALYILQLKCNTTNVKNNSKNVKKQKHNLSKLSCKFVKASVYSCEYSNKLVFQVVYRLLRLSQVWYNFCNWKCFKKDEKCFLFHLKSSLKVLEIFNFLSWLFGHVEKRLDQKHEDNFKIYGVTIWLIAKQLQNTFCPIFQEIKVIGQ